MKMKFFLFLAFFFSFAGLFAQEEPVEFYIIDSYVTPETPHIFKLTFFTSDSCTTKILFNNNKTYAISKRLNTDHKFTLNLTGFVFDSAFVPFYLIAKNKAGKEFKSEKFEVELPDDKELLQSESGGSIFNICLGGVSILIPSAGVYKPQGGEFKFSLSKQLPFITFGNIGGKYPAGYLALNYTYVFNNEFSNFLGITYKGIWQPGLIEYLALGGGVYSNLKGGYGFSPELEIGLVRIFNGYTLFVKEKFNWNVFLTGENANQIFVGIYAPFFSINY